jgi:hypothetical protein
MLSCYPLGSFLWVAFTFNPSFAWQPALKPLEG